MSDIVRWFRRCDACVDTACWSGQDFGKRNFFAGSVFGGEVVEVGAHETTIESGCYVIWVSFYVRLLGSTKKRAKSEVYTNHQTIIQHSRLCQSQLPNFIPQRNTSHNRRT